MKNTLALLVFVWLCCLSYTVKAEDRINSFSTPDINFPEDMATNARVALDESFRTGKQQETVLALAQYGLAKMAVTNHAVNEFVQLVDSVIQLGTLGSDYQSLLYVLEARAVGSIYQYRGDDQNPDISLWSQSKRDSLISSLYDKALVLEGQGRPAIFRPVSDYEGVLELGNSLGMRCLPTLYDFIAFQAVQKSMKSSGTAFLDNWLKHHETDQDVYPRMYIEQLNGNADVFPLYEKYKNEEALGLLFCLQPRDFERGAAYYQSYLKRFPNSPYADAVRYHLGKALYKQVFLNYPSLVPSTLPIEVEVNMTRVPHCTLTLYRIPEEMSTKTKILVSELQTIASIRVKAGKQETVTASFPAQPYGRYIILDSFDTPEGPVFLKEVPENSLQYSVLIVSDLRSFYTVTSDDRKIFAIDARSGKPLSGVEVSSSIQGKSPEEIWVQTNEAGFASVSTEGNCKCRLTLGEDRYLDQISASRYFGGKEKSLEVSLQTDLAIYRPGEKVQVSAIVYEVDKKSRRPKTDCALTLFLFDANHESIDSLSLHTDSWGAAAGEFLLPQDRMNGQYRIIAKAEDQWAITAMRTIEVSEYKLPTFSVDLSKTPTRQDDKAPAVVRGLVSTFSGMPVAGREVRLEFRPQTWWGSGADMDDRDTIVMTDAQGCFELLCPLSWTTSDEEDAEEDDDFYFRHSSCYRFKVYATCTNLAGESQCGQTSFLRGRGCRVMLSGENFVLEPGKTLTLPIHLQSTEAQIQEVSCRYELINSKGKTVKKGTFVSSKPVFNWNKVPSGEYRLKVEVAGPIKGEGFTSRICLFRETDALPPVKSSLWLPESHQRVSADGQAQVLIGTDGVSYIYYIAEGRKGLVGEGWLHYESGLHWFGLPMPAGKDEFLKIRFISCRDGNVVEEQVMLVSPEVDEVKFRLVTFRDKVVPGSRERWQLQLTDANGDPCPGRMVLELYSKALETLKSNLWQFRPRYAETDYLESNITTFSRRRYHRHYYSQYSENKSVPFELPVLNLFGYQFGSRRLLKTVRIRGKAASQEAVVSDDEVILEEAIPVGYGVSNDMSGLVSGVEMSFGAQKGSSAFNSVPTRSSVSTVALWEPSLTSDTVGNFSLEFDVPEDNTTWCLQALAYTKSMATTMVHREIVAQRPLMVQTSLPRFLLSGDETTLLANVQNASDSTLHVKALVELFDPRTDKVLDSREYELDLQAKGTQVVSISCRASMNDVYVGFRAKAVTADGNGDGEQQMIPVLPSESPIVETQAYFLAPQQKTWAHDIRIASGSDSPSRLTLEYCDNPIWYCVSSLPSLANSDGVTSPGLAHSLFANLLGARLAASFRPYIEKGKLLPYNLSQNLDLKIGSYKASPWLSAAERQQRQFKELVLLLDSVQNQSTYLQLKVKLQKLQQENGGFAWIENASFGPISSYWATSQVVEVCGELLRLGCLPEDEELFAMLARALYYLDRENIAREDIASKRADRDSSQVDYAQFRAYAYSRSLFDGRISFEDDVDEKANSIINQCVKALVCQWRTLPLLERGFVAQLLYRRGQKAEAHRMLESFRQLALKDAVKGMHWERIEHGSWSHPVAVTASILNAFAEIAPQAYAGSIQQIRQWLLLEKQTSDWGNGSMSADAIGALLNSGQDWTATTTSPTMAKFSLKVDGVEQSLDTLSAMCGYVRLELPMESHRIEVVRQAKGPAWGALYHQYVAPMSEVKADTMPELRIRKEYWVKSSDGKWVAASSDAQGRVLFHVGQEIQVRLIVTCSKDLEYLTLSDDRPACLEPVSQTSGYRWEDEFYYEEIKDAQTNLFLPRLGEGSHELRYGCYVTHEGIFSGGIASLQSQYAPQYNTHSSGIKIKSE